MGGVFHVKDTRIFDAWSDEGWVNEGAAVRVSLVCFGRAESSRLDGVTVQFVNSDLTATNLNSESLDLTQAQRIPANTGTCFLGPEKNGKFEISGELARDWLRCPNVNGLSSSLVLKPRYNGIDLQRRYTDGWVIDFGTSMSESDAAGFERPFEWVARYVKPDRDKNADKNRRVNWWRFGRTGGDFRSAIRQLQRYLCMSAHTRHIVFTWLDATVMPDKALVIVARHDDVYFGLLNSRFHQLWSLGSCTWLGVGNDARYNAGNCFETFPFPAGLTPADTAHQQTETLPNGAIIPLLADSYKENRPLAHVDKGPAAIDREATYPVIARSAATRQSMTVESMDCHVAGAPRSDDRVSLGVATANSASEPAPPGEPPKLQAGRSAATHDGNTATLRQHAERIANAAKRLNDLREAWLNPPEWTHKVPEVTPLGMDHSPYPDRIEPKPGISEQDLKTLQKRTLTNLYNAKPAWPTMAHQQLDAAVAAAYGWRDYTPAMADDEILKRLLALNLARATSSLSSKDTTK